LEIKKYHVKLKLDNILFRNCEFEDIPHVMYVNRATLPENYSRYTFLAIWRLYRDMFFVAIDLISDKIVGYVMNKVDTGPSFFDKRKVVSKGHVFSVGVLKEYRRRGIATCLMALAFKAMKQRRLHEVFLEVRVSNIPAIKLYEKIGMRIIGRIKRYYADGEDAYIMAALMDDVIDFAENVIDYLVKNSKVVLSNG